MPGAFDRRATPRGGMHRRSMRCRDYDRQYVAPELDHDRHGCDHGQLIAGVDDPHADGLVGEAVVDQTDRGRESAPQHQPDVKRAAEPGQHRLVPERKLTHGQTEGLAIDAGVEHGVTGVDEPGLADDIGCGVEVDDARVVGKPLGVEQDEIPVVIRGGDLRDDVVHERHIEGLHGAVPAEYHRSPRNLELVPKVAVLVREMHDQRYHRQRPVAVVIDEPV